MTSFLLNKRATGGSAGRGSVPRGNVTKTMAGECVKLLPLQKLLPQCLHWGTARIKDPDPVLGNVWCHFWSPPQSRQWLTVGNGSKNGRIARESPPVLKDRYDWTAPANKAEPLPATGLKVGFKVTSIKDGDCLAVSVGEGQGCWINWSETILNYYERSCRSLFWFRPNWF